MVLTTIKSCSPFNSDTNEVFLFFCIYSQYCNMTKRRWGNGWVHYDPQIHACSPCLLWSCCTHQRYGSMVWTAIKSCSPFNSDPIEFFLNFCTYSQYCNMTKIIWGNGWVHCGPQMNACPTFLLWLYCTHQISDGLVRTAIESCSPFNSDLN